MLLREDGVIVYAGRLLNPPPSDDEWEPPPSVQEAAGDETVRSRRAAGAAAGKAVRAEKVALERAVLQQQIRRLEALKRSILADLGSATDFRRFQAQSIIRSIDAEIARTNQALAADAQQAYRTAAQLGGTQVDETLYAAKFETFTSAAIDSNLVDAASENTIDLLSEAMLRFRNRIAPMIRRLTTAGANFGDEWVKLAASIEKTGLDDAAYRAERIVRTEMSRTFNSAADARAAELAERMPFMRKIWIRTQDSRTRPTHVDAGARYARGQGIPIPDKFQIGDATMRYPVDPLAEPAGKIAARETIMCRCNQAVDFDAASLRQETQKRVSLALGRAG